MGKTSIYGRRTSNFGGILMCPPLIKDATYEIVENYGSWETRRGYERWHMWEVA